MALPSQRIRYEYPCNRRQLPGRTPCWYRSSQCLNKGVGIGRIARSTERTIDRPASRWFHCFGAKCTGSQDAPSLACCSDGWTNEIVHLDTRWRTFGWSRRSFLDHLVFERRFASGFKHRCAFRCHPCRVVYGWPLGIDERRGMATFF